LKTSPPKTPATTVRIRERAAARLRHGHVWVYRSDLAGDPQLPPGSLVAVHDEKGKALGTAFYSSASQLALRLISRGMVTPKDLAPLVRRRITEAVDYRRKVVADSDAFRVIFSEADALPGFIADKYNDLVTLQALTQATDAPAFKDAAFETLSELLTPAAIAERVDPRIRELEKLPPGETRMLRGERSATIFTMNGVRFHYDALSGQKTGAFLDQRENYAAAARYAHGDALDVFCYQGGFALHLARRCAHVTAVDSSLPALQVAEQNEALNVASHSSGEVEWMEGNAFDVLKDYATAGKQYDTIVLDPPAFARSRQQLDAALRGYKELNLRALKMLRPGGVLVTCSCSYHVSEAEFLDMLAAAAADAHRTARIVEKRGQAKDHPAVLGIPETAYLKCLIASVV
jgi:23S rRNA (cytosine1962-C5)-methyltransferase